MTKGNSSLLEKYKQHTMPYNIDLDKLQRINVIATSGSGKSTFSKSLANILDIEYIEMDSLYWKDDWQFEDDTTLFEKVKKATDQDAWVLDGNYNRTQPVKWKNLQTLIWLDYPFHLVFFRVVKRSITRLFDKKMLWGTNNRESFRRSFMSKESIIHWVISSYHQMKDRYSRIFDKKTKEWQYFRFHSPRETEEFLHQVRQLSPRK